jgi:hypothetical protein
MVVLHNTLFVCLCLRKSLVALGVTTLASLHFRGLLHPHNLDLRDRCDLLASCREVNANCLPPLLRRHPICEIANWSSGHNQLVYRDRRVSTTETCIYISFTEVSNHSLSQQCACHCASVSANALLPSRLKRKSAASPTTRPQFSPLKLTCANRLLSLRKTWTSLNLPRHHPLCYRVSQRSSSARHRSHCCTVTEVTLLQRCQNTPLVHSEGCQKPHPLPAT